MFDVTAPSLEEVNPPPYTDEEKARIEKDYLEVKERMKVAGYEQTLEDQRAIVRHNRAIRETAFHIVQASAKPKKEKKVKESKEPGEIKERKTREKKVSEDGLAKQKQQELLAELGF